MRAAILMLALTSSVSTTYAYAQEFPDESEWGYEISGSASDFYFPKDYGVRAGGDLNISGCLGQSGYVTRDPDFTINVSDLAGYDISFRTEGTCDTMLLVNMPDRSWKYNDDIPGKLDSEIRLSDQLDGYYDVWIGTIGPGMCDATLYVETFSTS